MEYEVDTTKWTCTCTVSRTGYPSGEPCKHQHAVAQKWPQTYSLTLMMKDDTYMLSLHWDSRDLETRASMLE